MVMTGVWEWEKWGMNGRREEGNPEDGNGRFGRRGVEGRGEGR